MDKSYFFALYLLKCTWDRSSDNNYIAKFEVNFSKKEVLNFFEKKNIFSSIPKKKKLFILPILIDLTQNEILLFSENPFYINWNKFNEKHYLLEYIPRHQSE